MRKLDWRCATAMPAEAREGMRQGAGAAEATCGHAVQVVLFRAAAPPGLRARL